MDTRDALLTLCDKNRAAEQKIAKYIEACSKALKLFKPIGGSAGLTFHHFRWEESVSADVIRASVSTCDPYDDAIDRASSKLTASFDGYLLNRIKRNAGNRFTRKTSGLSRAEILLLMDALSANEIQADSLIMDKATLRDALTDASIATFSEGDHLYGVKTVILNEHETEPGDVLLVGAPEYVGSVFILEPVVGVEIKNNAITVTAKVSGSVDIAHYSAIALSTYMQEECAGARD